MAPALLPDLSPLRASRDFRALWLSQATTNLGRQFVPVAVPYQVYLRTHSSLAVGLLGIFQAVPIVVTGLYGGALADRLDRRRLQLAGKSVSAACSLALAIGAMGLRAPVPIIYAIVVVAAAAWTLDQASRRATVATVVSRSDLASAMAIDQTLTFAALIAGPALAGLALARAGLSWTYAVDVIGFLPAAALVSRVSPQRPAAGHTVTIGWRAPAQALGYVARSPLLTSLAVADLIAMIFGMPMALFPALALSVLQVGPGGLGLLYAAPAIGSMLASLLSGWVRTVRRQGLAVCVAITVWGVAIAGFGLAGRHLWLGVPLLVIAGAGDMVSAVFRGTILQLTIPDSMRGRMSAFHLMVVSTGPRLGDLEAGLVAALAGPVFSVVSGGLACVVGIAVLAALVPELREARAPEPTPRPAEAPA